MTPSFVLGYGTNGFTDHPLPAALDVMAHHGYRAVALTLGHPHLDPFSPDWREQTLAVGEDLRRRGMRVVVETGTRFLLDPFRKHRPTLVDRQADARMRFLTRAVEIAALLEADCVSIWSGVLPEDVTEAEAWELLVERMREVVAVAQAHDVTVSFEPEPGMVVETVADALRLIAALDHPSHLGITVDLGHCVAVEPDGVEGALRAAGSLLRNVQVDDMLPGVHEHLPFGEGELDLDLAFRTLVDLGYAGVAAIELPRHSHAAPDLASASMRAMKETSVFTTTNSHPWITEALAAIDTDPTSVDVKFAMAGRKVGRDPVESSDPLGFIHGTTDDHARSQLLAAVIAAAPAEAAETVQRLYQRGDDAERRGVLIGLNQLDADQHSAALIETGVEIILDALRTNDPRLVAAAMGDFAAAHLDQHSWSHGVLKVIFMEVPLAAVARLDERVDDETRAMARRLVIEREAAGRVISADLSSLAGDTAA